MITTRCSQLPLPDWSAELLDIVSISYEWSTTVNVYASAAFLKFSFMKKFLYLEKYKLLTKQAKFSCSSLQRNEAENIVGAAHKSSRLTHVCVCRTEHVVRGQGQQRDSKGAHRRCLCHLQGVQGLAVMVQADVTYTMDAPIRAKTGPVLEGETPPQLCCVWETTWQSWRSSGSGR